MPGDMHDHAKRVSWLVNYLAPRKPVGPDALLVDARRPAAAQAHIFRELGWSEGPALPQECRGSPFST